MKNKLAVLTAVAACVLALCTGRPAPADAAVEYVKVCSLYGAGYFYIPGTDICYNVRTGETQRATEGGQFSALVTKTPGYWVKAANRACSGRVRTIGTYVPGNLTLDQSHGVYETTPSPFTLGKREYIAGIFMKGGFGDPAIGFCVSIRDSQGTSAVLGCQEQSVMRETPATWKMIPYRSAPAAAMVGPFYFVGSNADTRWSDVPTTGKVTLSACIETAPQ